jgi:hypothetical protein
MHNYTGSLFAIYRERDLCCSIRLLLSFFAAALIACLAGCGGGSSTPGPPSGTQHLYTDSTPGQARQFALPLAGNSPTATLSIPAANSVAALALDSAGNLAIGDVAGNITIFSGPITGSSSASATFKNGTSTFVDQLVFNSAGDLFVTTHSNTINVFTHPLTSASTPSQVITSASLTSTVGIALDSAGNLIVGNRPSPLGSNVLVFAPPYTGAPIVTGLIPAASFGEIAISGTELFVANSLVSTSQINVYNLPITAASVPAFSISNGIFGGSVSATGVAVDSSGNLYVGLGGNLGTTDSGGVRIYVPPFSSASAPSVTAGVFAFTMAVGK